MTYDEFLAESQRRQRAYLAGRQKTLRAAFAAYAKYSRAMHALGLHPADYAELEEREREVRRMRVELRETHGDCEAMRLAYASKPQPVSAIAKQYAGKPR